MRNETLEIFRGVTTKIDINIKNSDKKSLQLAGRTLTFYLVSLESKSNVLIKPLTEINGSKGQYQAIISEGESRDWNIGQYRLTVTLLDESENEQILFTDLGYGASTEVVVRENILEPFVPSITSDASTWGENTGKWFSSAYAADSQFGSNDGLHTIALYMTEFTGKFWVQASLESSVPVNASEWFDLNLSDATDYLTFSVESTLQNIDFIVNAQWIRFVYEPDFANTGSVDQVLYRS